MSRNDIKRGLAHEKRIARKHNAKHIGGPGKEDYRRGSVLGEVKATKAKMTKPTLRRNIKKGISEFDTKSGYTKPALAYRDRYHPEVKLFQNGKKLKPKCTGHKREVGV